MLAVQKECWNLKKINLCSYTACTVGHLRPRLRACVTRHFWFDERGAEANPAQVTSHHCCLHSPGFTRKQRKSEQLRRLCCSPSCSGVPVLSQTEDVCSVYPIPKDKTLSLLCHEKTDWQQAWMRHRRAWFHLFSEHSVSMLTTLTKGYMITTINLYLHQNKTKLFPFLHSLC